MLLITGQKTTIFVAYPGKPTIFHRPPARGNRQRHRTPQNLIDMRRKPCGRLVSAGAGRV